MKRWVNDYNMAEKIGYGYRLVLPVDIKDVGGGTQAVLMEMSDADYKANQIKKQIENDKIGPFGGHDLAAYKKDVNLEARQLVVSGMTKSQVISLALRRLFGFRVDKYLDKILPKDAK